MYISGGYFLSVARGNFAFSIRHEYSNRISKAVTKIKTNKKLY